MQHDPDKKGNSIHLSKCSACVHTCTLAANCISNLQRLKSSPLHVIFWHSSSFSSIRASHETSIIAISIYMSSSQWATSERKWIFRSFALHIVFYVSQIFSFVGCFFAHTHRISSAKKLKRLEFILVICYTIVRE